MGTAYKADASGANLGNLYGLAWTHSNVGVDYAGSHQLLHVINGTVTCAMGTNLWTSGTVTASGGNSGEWNSAYDDTNAATNSNTGNRLVKRDANGSFSAGTITAALSGNASTATRSGRFDSSTHAGTYWLTNSWDGSYWKIDSNHSSGTRVDYANSAGSASSATSATSAGLAGTVTINYNNNSASTYQMLWGSGNSVYGTAGVYVNPSTNTIYATGDIIAAASDDRLKDKKGNIENALDKVNALNGFHYNWNDKAVELGFKTEEQKEEEHIGLSAQDVQKVAPELVTESSVEGYDTVRYDKVTALLVEAVKELTEQNKELKAEIESLKSINS
jgi:hypothetical protein